MQGNITRKHQRSKCSNSANNTSYCQPWGKHPRIRSPVLRGGCHDEISPRASRRHPALCVWRRNGKDSIRLRDLTGPPQSLQPGRKRKSHRGLSSDTRDGAQTLPRGSHVSIYPCAIPASARRNEAIFRPVLCRIGSTLRGQDERSRSRVGRFFLPVRYVSKPR